MSEETTKIAGEYIVEPNLKEVSDSLSEQSIDITNIVKNIDTKVFLKKFQEATEQELTNLLVNLKNSEDKKTVQEISLKMIALYQKMYFVKTEKERASIQRTLNNYKSAVAAISARYELDVANAIINICKKSSAIALSCAISFVAL